MSTAGQEKLQNRGSIAIWATGCGLNPPAGSHLSDLNREPRDYKTERLQIWGICRVFQAPLPHENGYEGYRLTYISSTTCQPDGFRTCAGELVEDLLEVWRHLKGPVVLHEHECKAGGEGPRVPLNAGEKERKVPDPAFHACPLHSVRFKTATPWGHVHKRAVHAGRRKYPIGPYRAHDIVTSSEPTGNHRPPPFRRA